MEDRKRKKEKAHTPEEATLEEQERGYALSEEEEALIEERRARQREEGALREARRQRKNEGLRPSGGRSFNGGGVYKPAIIVGLVVLAITYVLIGAIGVSKDDFTRNIGDVLATMETVKEEIATSKTALDNAVAGLSNTVTTQVNTALDQVNSRLNTIETNTNSAKDLATTTNAQIGTISGDIEALKASLANVSAKITGLNAEMSAAEGRLGVLERQLADDDDDTDIGIPFDYSVSLRDDGFPTGADNKTTLSVRVILENKTSKDIEDVSMEFEAEVYGDNEDIHVGFRPRVSLTGWRVKEWGVDYVILKGTGIDIEHNDKYSKVLNIELQFTGDTSGVAEIDEDYIEITNWSYE